MPKRIVVPNGRTNGGGCSSSAIRCTDHLPPRGPITPMRLVTYIADGTQRAGVLVGERVVDTAHAARGAGLGSSDAQGSRVRDLLSAPPETLAKLAAAAEEADGVDVESVELGPPVPDPEKILCIGLNYREHAQEGELAIPTSPIVFAKFRSALVGDRAQIHLPDCNPGMVDFEGELAVVIGRRARKVPESQALQYVAGYMPFNDVTARDVQLSSSQWTMGKAFDTSGPCGPARSGCVERLPHRPLGARELEVPRRDVVERHVAGDVLECLGLRDLPGSATDHHRELTLEIDHPRVAVGQVNLGAVADEGGAELGEHDRRGRDREFPLLCVLAVIQSDAEDLLGIGHGRAELDALDVDAVGLLGRSRELRQGLRRRREQIAHTAALS